MRRMRLNRGLTQQALADLAQVEYKHLQHIETGSWPNLTLGTVQRISDALKVKPWELICDVPADKKGGTPPKRSVRGKSKER